MVTGFYFVVLVCVVLPAWEYASLGHITNPLDVLTAWEGVFWVGLLVTGAAILLVVPVDTSFRPAARKPVLVSIAAVGSTVGLLTYVAVWSAAIAIKPKDAVDVERLFDPWLLLGGMATLWMFWSAIFYRYSKDCTDLVTRAVSWLLTGSVLELLVAVPCHVYVRRRGDCSAPAATGFGIATGIAVMILSFGPSVLFLYKRRLEQYERRSAPPALH